MTPEADRWADVPIVFITRPVCPRCRSARSPIIVRSEHNGDGSTTRKCVCAFCSRRYKVVVELPGSGNAGDPDLYDEGHDE
jgi:hypothetical protein